MILTLILAVLLAILVLVARNDPGGLPEVGRTAGKAIENQINRVTSAVSEAAPAAPTTPPPLQPVPDVRAETAIRETPAVKKQETPRVAAAPSPRLPEVSTMPRPAFPADGPAMPAVPRLPVGEAPLDAVTQPSTPIPSPEPRRNAAPAQSATVQSTGTKSVTPQDESQRTQKAETYLRNAARILSQTELPR